jgi:hypothetical protein
VSRRGKIRPLVKSFPPVGRLHWKKKKLLTILANRKQWLREFDPTESATYEIEMEHLSGYYLITQSSSSATPTYIITE